MNQKTNGNSFGLLSAMIIAAIAFIGPYYGAGETVTRVIGGICIVGAIYFGIRFIKSM